MITNNLGLYVSNNLRHASDSIDQARATLRHGELIAARKLLRDALSVIETQLSNIAPYLPNESDPSNA